MKAQMMQYNVDRKTALSENLKRNFDLPEGEVRKHNVPSLISLLALALALSVSLSLSLLTHKHTSRLSLSLLTGARGQVEVLLRPK